MDRLTTRRGRAGLTLVELLVVLAMIGVLSAVLIPLAVRGGWSSGSKTAFAARDVFTLLKAARVYASTHNVETALVYGGTMVQDSEITGNPCVPIVDSVLLARRLKRAEMIEFIETNPGLALPISATDIFVRVTTNDGEFRQIPKDMTILPEIFLVDGSNNSTTGLTGVRVFAPEVLQNGVPVDERDMYLAPRTDTCSGSPTEGIGLNYRRDSDPGTVWYFPAHSFLPDGTMRTPEGPQRLRFRIGPRPDMTFRDRFHVNPDTVESLDEEPRTIFFNGTVPVDISILLYDDNEDSTDNYPEVDAWIELFVPTGRVKLLP